MSAKKAISGSGSRRSGLTNRYQEGYDQGLLDALHGKPNPFTGIRMKDIPPEILETFRGYLAGRLTGQTRLEAEKREQDRLRAKREAQSQAKEKPKSGAK